MLMPASAASWPLRQSSSRRLNTCPGEGRKSGRIMPVAVKPYQAMPSAANTAVEIARYSSAVMRPPSLNRRRGRCLLSARRIHEATVDRLCQVDILLQDLSLARCRVHFRNDLLGEAAAELVLVLGERVVDDTLEGGGELFRLGADRPGNDRPAAGHVLAIVGERHVPCLEQGHDLSRLVREEFLAHHEDVGDEARVLACGI